ncbi:hypothetical protein C8Q73DRAFT_837353 [Cubamyces lactineus]|nr:hypothetical protein C8Q73DRAFT_837353 [Cubamyces lactineus]
MNPFSRIIARPFFAQQRTLDVVADEPAVPQAFAHPVNTERRSSDAENIDLLQKFSATRIWEDGSKNKSKPGEDHILHIGHPYQADGFVKPFPRLFSLARTDSLRSLPSLCSDDGLTESTRSISPAITQSPPATGSSTMAVLGSPGFMTGFGDEYDHPEDDPDFVRNELRKSRSLRRQARMRDGDFRLTDDERDFSVTDEPVVLPRPPRIRPVNKNAARMHAQNGGANAVRKCSRLNQRVKVPPALNTAAIKAYTLLSMLVRGTYDIEVRDVDGSAISDNESGFEADDEGDFDSPNDATEPQTSFHIPGQAAGASVALNSMDAGHGAGCTQAPAKKTYAAVVAATSESSSALVMTKSTQLTQDSDDWMDRFALQGPSVKILDL